MARVSTKIGDVFSVKIDENSKKYFQLVAFDLTQLNSDVIRAFKKVYPLNANSDLTEVVNGEVEFYAHCVTKIGLKMGYWEYLQEQVAQSESFEDRVSWKQSIYIIILSKF